MSQSCPQCALPLPDDAPEGSLCAACLAAAPEESAATIRIAAPGETVLETIGDFAVLSKLGQGGMGAVYRARQISLGRLVALKVLPVQFGDDPEFIGRFQREAKVAASLTHPNLVRVYSAGQTDGSHFIAMELIEGENLHQRQHRERLPVDEALRITAEVARGLQFGWEKAQLVHRDIKPSNIYLSHGGDVKVGDLGLAKSLTGNTTGLTQTGTMMGTPYYMSPEQIRGDKALDFRADIYSLGCTLYELLTGKVPYPGTDPISIATQHMNAPLPPIMKALPGAPMPLVRLMGKMLKKQPRERHQSYEDLIAEIEWVREQIQSGSVVPGASAVGQEPLGSAPPSTAARSVAPRPAAAIGATSRKSNFPLYGAAAAGLLLLGAVGWILTRPAKPARQGATASHPATPHRAEEPHATIDSREPWQPITDAKPMHFGEIDSLFEPVPGGVRVKGLLNFSGGPRRDSAIRIRAPFSPFLAKLKLLARRTHDQPWAWYQGYVEDSGTGAGPNSSTPAAVFRSRPDSRAPHYHAHSSRVIRASSSFASRAKA